VLDCGELPTPLLYFAALRHADGCGAMVTGSHNPPEYNGLKMMLGGETLGGEAIQALRRRIETGAWAEGAGGLRGLQPLPEYLQAVCADVRLARPLRVALDCGNGAAGPVILPLLQQLGCEVAARCCCEVDGSFPHHHPDPSQPENLQGLIAAVRESGADLGLAFDGDGDRLGVVGPDGRIVWPDRLLMLLARDLLGRHPGAEIVYDVKCSALLETVIREAGGRPCMWRTGHAPLKAKLRADGALLGGEMSGHLFIAERWSGVDDAPYAAARLLEILARDGRPVQTQFAELPERPSTPELRVEMAEGAPQQLMVRLLAHSDAFAEARLTTLDGLRVDFADGWGLVRASNTTPSLTLRFEAVDPAALARIMARFRRWLLSIDPALGLPF
jgi:phosphomannomutase/phosphoglucomutase